MPEDPLMLAFAEDEVRQAGAVSIGKTDPNTADSLTRKLPNPDKAALAGDQLKLAAKAIQEDNLSFALKLVSQARLGLGAQAPVYVNAADAYIRLQRFHEAEICLLHALQLGGPSLPHFINLITLASMRGDFSLAHHYVDAAAAIDPKYPQLIQVRDQLKSKKRLKRPLMVFIKNGICLICSLSNFLVSTFWRGYLGFSRYRPDFLSITCVCCLIACVLAILVVFAPPILVLFLSIISVPHA